MAMDPKVRSFFLPSFTEKFLVRVSLVALIAYLFFSHICVPLRIEGQSMEPTYHDGGFNLCWRLRYLLSKPKRHDVVAVRFAGNRVMLLKRVVAVEGEEIEFRDGKLFVNGKQIDEPYVRFSCDWNLSPRRVEKDYIYVVGDNRSMPLEDHTFGQAPIHRIVGATVW
jgi:signal peptidase I